MRIADLLPRIVLFVFLISASWLPCQAGDVPATPYQIKVIWRHKVARGKEVVVEERSSSDTPTDYLWRLNESGKNDGPIFFMVAAFTNVGTAPEIKPVTVLYTDVTPAEDLITVYNQRGRCWGYVVKKKTEGLAETMPRELFSSAPPAMSLADSSITSEMKAATMEQRADGSFHVSCTDGTGTVKEYNLVCWTYFRQILYYWRPAI